MNENQMETPINQNEFAEKPPLLSPAYKKGLRIGLISCLGIMVFAIGGLIIYRQLQEIIKNKKLSSIDPNFVTNPTPTIDNTKLNEYFSYIKNKKEIWIVDTNGENKAMISELSPSNASIFSTLDWKDKTHISYSECNNERPSITDIKCKIKTYDIETKATNDEYETDALIRKFSWSLAANYLSIVEDTDSETFFKIKAGTVTNTLNKFYRINDLSNTQGKTLFTADSQYVLFYSINGLLDETKSQGNEIAINPSSTIEVYYVNGVKVEHIEGANDPFLLNDGKMGFKKDNKIVYRTIGKSDETVITSFNGFNSEISPNKNLIAYWYAEGNLSNVILGVFDSELNIHRNILRGIILPIWINNDKILGIKADNCLGGTSCQLYEFQTNSISLIDVEKGNVKQIDQGRKISEATYKSFN